MPPAILIEIGVAGFSMSKEGCFITQKEVNAVFDEQVRLCAETLQRKKKEYRTACAEKGAGFWNGLCQCSGKQDIPTEAFHRRQSSGGNRDCRG